MDKPTTKGVMWRLIVCVSLLCCSSEAQVTCRDENGAAVDWFIIYKVPNVKPFSGLEYYYIDSTGAQREPSSNHHINNPSGSLAGTLEPMFKPIKQMSDDFAFISYSDQPPGAQATSDWFGHSKGVVMMDRTSSNSTGVWLLHSTPQFPFRRDANNFWPQSGNVHAQTFLCVTLKYKDFKQKIGAHLQYIRAYPFDFDVPVGFHQDLPDMMNIINWIQNPPPITDPEQFRAFWSNGKALFLSVTKKQSPDGDREVGDLYIAIADGFQSDVMVQSWPTQGDVSYCPATGFKVFNIKSVKTNWGWGSGSDNSKWCIATDKTNRVTCIGDVNRAESQYKQSGGALCFNDANVWKMFYGMIETHEPCP